MSHSSSYQPRSLCPLPVIPIGWLAELKVHIHVAQ